MRMEDKEEIVITLVHGTFAQNAEWTLGDSPFCESLKRSLPGPLTLLPFQWSGKNSERARQVAVRDLRQRLRLSILEHPSSRHFVIGHSHGGNISVQAVMGTDLERQVAGITCLAVPFLFMSPRLQTYEIRNFKALRSDEVTFYLFAIMGLCMLGASLGICAAFILNIDPAKVSIAPPTTLLAGQAHTRKGASIFDVESGPRCQDHFSGAISLGSASLILRSGATGAAPAIPALEPALGSHSCGALSSAQVPPL